MVSRSVKGRFRSREKDSYPTISVAITVDEEIARFHGNICVAHEFL